MFGPSTNINKQFQDKIRWRFLRINKGFKCLWSHIIKDEISNEITIKVFNSDVVSTLNYEKETWATTQKDLKTLAVSPNKNVKILILNIWL